MHSFSKTSVQNLDFSASVQFDWCYSHITAMQMVTMQRLDLRPNNDGSVCCAVGPLIKVLHATLMTDRGERMPARLAPPISLLAAFITVVAGRLEESLGRHTEDAGPSHSWC